MKKLTHIDGQGKSRMVDVSGKIPTEREAVARGAVFMKKSTLRRIRQNLIAKGDVLAAARIAGIMAAKRTPDLIPLCHPLSPTSVRIEFGFDLQAGSVIIESRVKVIDRTGAEMEALVGAAVAGLTIYDMCKAIDKGMILGEIMLIEKSGGKSGAYRRE